MLTHHSWKVEHLSSEIDEILILVLDAELTLRPEAALVLGQFL